MQIEEIKTKRDNLSLGLKKLLEEFIQDTGIKPDVILYGTEDNYTEDKQNYKVVSKVTILL